jgi:predicted TPR repeat methyltransferase
MQAKDYRNSHLAPDKGMTYAKTFEEFPYRNYVWSWEKKVLKDVINDYFQGNEEIQYLDFACGTGRIIGYLENLVGTSVGVDISDSMLEIGRQSVKRSKLIKADLTQENIFAGETFDLITAFRFFLNAQPELREAAITILSSLLSDHGYLVFNIHMNQGSTAERMRSIYNRIKHRPKDSYHTMGRQQVLKMVEKAGLQLVGTYHFGLIPIVNEKSRFPEHFFGFIEEAGSKIPYLESPSRYVIYICKRKRGN